MLTKSQMVLLVLAVLLISLTVGIIFGIARHQQEGEGRGNDFSDLLKDTWFLLYQESPEGKPLSTWIKEAGDPDPDVRRRAVRALGRLCVSEAIPVLVYALGDDAEPRVWYEAQEHIGCVGPQHFAAVPRLTPILNDPNSYRSRGAAYALGRIGPKAKDAIPDLVTAAQRDDPPPEPEALVALAQIEGAAAIPIIKQTLELHPTNEMREAAGRAIGIAKKVKGTSPP